MRINALAQKVLYPGWDSNPHSFEGNRILSPARLPIPPPGPGKQALSLSYEHPIVNVPGRFLPALRIGRAADRR